MKRRRHGFIKVILWIAILAAIVSANQHFEIDTALRQLWDNSFQERAESRLDLSDLLGTKIAKITVTPTPKLAEESEVTDNFYYSQMNERQKIAYRQIVAAIQDGKMEAECPVRSENAVQEVFQGVVYDYPEFFWISEDYTIYNINEGERFQIELNYNIEESQLSAMKEQIEAVCQSFFDTVPADADMYTKVRMAYDYLVMNTEYQAESEQNQNIQSVFLQHSSVCAGYTKAFKYLLNRMGIPCLVVYGSIAENGENHSWNIAEIDGMYYEIDCTWGEAMDGTDRIVYDYFCITTEEMNRSHIPTAEYQYPECVDRGKDYYICNGTYMEYYDAQWIKQCMLESVSNGEERTYLKFANAEDYALAKQGIESGELPQDAAQQKMQWDGLAEYQYRYVPNDSLYTVTMLW